jgi:predicted RNase H-like HicB family nuclease
MTANHGPGKAVGKSRQRCRSAAKKGDGRQGSQDRRKPIRYTVVLKQGPDGGYVVSVPARPGCVSQGNTRGEALTNIREAIELYVADCRDADDPVPSEAGEDAGLTVDQFLELMAR